MNERVVFDNRPGISYDIYEETNTPKNYNNSLKSIQTGNPLSQFFFSNKNVEILHQSIIMEVFKTSGNRIGRQSDTELQIIMRSIYLQYSENNNCNIISQVKVLNKKVLDYCVEKINRAISSYLTYKNDISSMPVPLTHPRNLSNAGEKSLSFFKPI